MIETLLDVERQQVLQTTEEEVKAVESGEIERYLPLLTEDAVFMPQNQTTKTGAELRPWLRAFLERVSIRYTRFDHGETIVRDDLAVHSYSCEWIATPRPSGKALTTAFKGMQVLRRASDGSWKIAMHIWNTDPEPARR